MMLVDRLRRDRLEEVEERPVAPIRSRNAIRKIIAGKNASSELYATCCERPMQSSARNSLPLDLKTASQSRRLSAVRAGCRQRRRPISRIVAPIPPAMTNPAARAPAVITGQLRAHLRSDVRRLANLVPEVVDGAGQLRALGLDLVPDLVGRPVVRA